MKNLCACSTQILHGFRVKVAMAMVIPFALTNGGSYFPLLYVISLYLLCINGAQVTNEWVYLIGWFNLCCPFAVHLCSTMVKVHRLIWDPGGVAWSNNSNMPHAMVAIFVMATSPSSVACDGACSFVGPMRALPVLPVIQCHSRWCPHACNPYNATPVDLMTLSALMARLNLLLYIVLTFAIFKVV